MKSFIKNVLINTKCKNLNTLDYHLECDDGSIISIVGNVQDEKATFTITRTVNGHQCSSIPVMEMPLTDEYIERIVHFAIDNL